MNRTHKGKSWTPLEINGVTSSRHPSAEVMEERLARMEGGRCCPEVRKAIQFKQFLKHLETWSNFENLEIIIIK